MTLETQLRDALASRADDVHDPAFDPYERVNGAVVTSRRRRRVATAGAVAAVAAVALLVPVLGQGGDRSTLPAEHTQLVVPGPNDPRWNAMSSWPVRGSLATDEAFIRSITEKFLTAHVVYAADLDRTRVVVGWDPQDAGSTRISMFAGPRGAGADQLTGVSEWTGNSTDLVVLRESDDPDSRVVAMTTPGVRTLAFSPGVQVAVDGTVTRGAYRPVTLTDGVWSQYLQSSPPSLMRVLGPAAARTPATLTGPPARQRDDLGSICFSCKGEDFRAKAEQAMGASAALRLGVEPADARTTTIYYGPADRTVAKQMGLSDMGAPGDTAELIVTDTTLPQGQVLRSALVVVKGQHGNGASMEIANGVPIDAATAAARPYVLGATGLGEGTASAQVFAPGAASVQLVSDAPTIYPSSKRLPLVDGSALFTTRSAAPERTVLSVVSYDAGGREIGRWPLDLPSEDQWTAGTKP